MDILKLVTPTPTREELEQMGHISLSQSLIKDWWKYWAAEECGLLFEAVHIKRIVEKRTSDAKRMGEYFEYLSTGQPPRDGEAPKPDRISTLNSKGEAKKQQLKEMDIKVKDMVFDEDDYELSAAYKMIQAQAERLKKAYKIYGYEIIGTGLKLWHQTVDYYTNGVIDSIGTMNGVLVIRDTKMTGLLNDKWSDFGWHPDRVKYNKKILIQAIHYKFLAMKMLGIRNIPFFFDVYANNEANAHCYEISIDDDDFDKIIASHEDMLIDLQRQISFQNQVGYEPYPEMGRCIGCPLFETCDKKTIVPTPREIVIK